MNGTELTQLIACVVVVLIALGVLYVALKLWLDAPKKFKGLLIPEGLTPDTAELIFHGGRCCFAGADVSCPHEHIGDCNKCLCFSEHRDELLEWLSEQPTKSAEQTMDEYRVDQQLEDKMSELKKDEVPGLKSGDVFKDVHGRWFLVVTPKEGYAIDPTTLRISMHYFLRAVNPVEIYRENDGDVFGSSTLESIMNEECLDTGWLFWKKPEPVKEMTVDQISKELGYKVKVVGNE